MPMTRPLILAAAAASLLLVAAPMGGCAYLSGEVANITQGHTTSAAQDANDLGSAERLAKTAFIAMDGYISVAHLSVSQLTAIDGYRVKIKTELQSLRDAHARGESLTFTAFNDALHAWLNWKTQHGSV